MGFLITVYLNSYFLFDILKTRLILTALIA
nr:MAG TPA: hypothetical protein [Caudoviricetes sp.]